MRTVQPGDRVKVHYVKRLQDGSVASSRSRGAEPLEITVGIDHPRLPGLGLDLVGLAPGDHVKLTVPADKAYGPHDPGRIRRLALSRFSEFKVIPIGNWVHILNRKGQRRLVRVLEVRRNSVVVDTNRRGAGQVLELKVKMVAIESPDKHSAGN